MYTYCYLFSNDDLCQILWISFDAALKALFIGENISFPSKKCPLYPICFILMTKAPQHYTYARLQLGSLLSFIIFSLENWFSKF